MGSLPLSSKFIHKLMFESGHIVLMYFSRCFPLFLLVVVLLSSLHHKHFLGLAVHLQFCYNEEGHVSVISIIRSIHLLMYDTLIFPFLWDVCVLSSNKIGQVNLNYLNQVSCKCSEKKCRGSRAKKFIPNHTESLMYYFKEAESGISETMLSGAFEALCQQFPLFFFLISLWVIVTLNYHSFSILLSLFVKIHKNYKNHSKCVIILFTVDVEIRW